MQIRSAKEIGLDAPEDTRVIVAKASATDAGDVLRREKLCPVISVMSYKTLLLQQEQQMLQSERQAK